MKFKNYDNYVVYEDGRIYSYNTKKFLKPSTLPSGYQVVNLYDNDGKRKTYYLHRVIYEAVTGEPIPEGMQCNHINECKSDNRFCNINLMSPKQNCNWGSRNERIGNTNSKVLTNNPKLSKPVGAFKDCKLVMKFASTQEAERNGFKHSNISKC